MRIALIAGGFPPGLDAIGSYTWWLGQALSAEGHNVNVLTGSAKTDFSFPGGRVVNAFDPARPDSLRNLPDRLRELGGVDWLVVQYNPFSFGPRGYCPQLGGALKRIKAEGLARIAIMFHETCVPLEFNKFGVMWTWQYLLFVRLCRMADRLFVSTGRWVRQINLPAPQARPVLLPVGSNLPLCPLNKAEARQQLSLPLDTPLLGVFGNAHPSRASDWAGDAARAWKAIHPAARVLYVGKDAASLRPAFDGVDFDDHGALPGDEAALRLRTMDVLLTPFTDGISTRRGSAIAALQHDVPILTTKTEDSDEMLLRNPLVFASPISNGKEGFVAETRRLLAQKECVTFDFAHSPFAWPVMARQLIETLEGRA